MRIVYLVDYDLNQNSGVVQKIKQQAFEWVRQGHTVYFISTITMSIQDSDENILFQLKPLDIKFGRLGTAIKLLYRSLSTNKLLEKVDFDIVYMRYRLYMPFFNRIFHNNKVIMEINSDDTIEYKLHSKLTHYYNILTRKFLLKKVDTFVSVSSELKKRFLFLNKKILVIANGINVSDYEIGINTNKKPILVFIGTPNQPWHGMDKIKSMANYFQDFQFYILGTDAQDTHNVKYFGYMSNKESTAIINQCDIGIGTLSLYKKGLEEASPLKTRQYLACGLPVIYAYKDTDIDESMQFTLRLENREDNLDFIKIELFVDKIFNNKNISSQAREFAEKFLDYEKKEKRRLNFFKEILDEK